ncbi:hypothetical protein AcV5_001577 [Taiwanofungus camphoratus]|nr:hypothetical protein AcV5_001577 [Antrodia cinnamomea]KAI0922414.1 hypothetical protein AcV7_005951 [Antrodia cinnamomea]
MNAGDDCQLKPQGMNLAYQTKASGNAKKQLRVEFDPPLAGYEEVKPRLLSMKVDAEEALGMAPAPQITSFEVPANAYILLTGTMILLLIYVTFAPAPTSPTYSPLFKAGYTLRSSLPPWAVPASWYGGGFIHILEALYAYTMCKKHRTGLWTGVQYVLGTLFLGFPILIELRRQRHNARIDSILKGK